MTLRMIARALCLLTMLAPAAPGLAADLEFGDNGVDPARPGAQTALDLMRHLSARGTGVVVLRHAPGVSQAQATQRRNAFRAFLMFQGIQSRDFGPMPVSPSPTVAHPGILSVRAQITLTTCVDRRRLYVEYGKVRNAKPADMRLHGEGAAQLLMLVAVGNAIGAFDAVEGLALGNLGHGTLTARLVNRATVPAELRGEWLYDAKADALRQVGGLLRPGDVAMASRQLGTPERPSGIWFPPPPPPPSPGQTRAAATPVCAAEFDMSF